MCLCLCVSQVVYFHNPKFSRQQQLPLPEIPATTINALPLMTELFPDISVFYDDDPVIPFLTSLESQGAGENTSAAQKRPTNNNNNKQPKPRRVPATIEDFIRPQQQLKAPATATRPRGDKYAWLICCSTVFLIDTEAQHIWASPDESILPLVSLFLTSEDMDTSPAKAGQSLLIPKKVDMSTAHGHITVLSKF